MFMDICCRYWHRLGAYALADCRSDFDEETVTRLLAARILEEDGDKLVIKFLDEQMVEREALSKRNSMAGKKGMDSRWNNESITDVKQSLTSVKRPNNGRITKHNNIEEKRREKKREEENIPPIIPQGGSASSVKTEFLNNVLNAGKDTYTPEMLQRFTEYWTEVIQIGRHKGKYRFEGELTWNVEKRLASWANRNLDGIVCYLADVKAISDKKAEFTDRMKDYLHKFPRDHMNSFFRYWAQPENAKNPKFLRWEKEEHWDLGMRLTEWSEREKKREAEKAALNKPDGEKVQTYRNPDNLVT